MSAEKKWESGPKQEHLDDRVKEQLNRALKESERRKETLVESEEKTEGSYKEKNGDDEEQFEGDKEVPKTDQDAGHPQTDN